MNKIAREAYKKLKEGKTFQDCETEIDRFQKYLESVLDKHYPSKYRIEGTLKCVFDRNPKLDTDNQIDRYCICNLKIASESLRRATNKVSEYGFNSTMKKFFIDLLCDIKPFVVRFDNQIDYEWLLLNTNTHISNFYHNLLENLFYSHQVGSHPEEPKVLVTSLPFLLRQSIEIKVRRVLGIDYWTVDSKPDLRSFETSIRVLRNNHDLGFYKKFDLLNIDLLSNLYDWSNEYVHGGYRACPWLMEAAIHYTKPLFSKYSIKSDSTSGFSLFGAIQADPLQREELIEETSRKLEHIFNDKEVHINWSSSFDLWWVNQ